MPSERATSTIFKVFGMTRRGIEPATSRSLRGRCTTEPLCRSAQADMVLEEISLEEFQDGPGGGFLGYQNETIILVILNLCVSVMLPIKFWLNPTYGLGGYVV